MHLPAEAPDKRRLCVVSRCSVRADFGFSRTAVGCANSGQWCADSFGRAAEGHGNADLEKDVLRQLAGLGGSRGLGRCGGGGKRVAVGKTKSDVWGLCVDASASDELTRVASELAIVCADLFKLVVFEFLKIKKGVVSSVHGADEFIELYLYRCCIFILAVLNEKDHEERDDRRACVDYELPGITEVKDWPECKPHEDNANGKEKCEGMSSRARRPAGRATEDIRVFHVLSPRVVAGCARHSQRSGRGRGCLIGWSCALKEECIETGREGSRDGFIQTQRDCGCRIERGSESDE